MLHPVNPFPHPLFDTFNTKVTKVLPMEIRYIGTYPIRRIGKSEQGIHMPSDLTGDYKIEQDQITGVITLTPQGKRV